MVPRVLARTPLRASREDDADYFTSKREYRVHALVATNLIGLALAIPLKNGTLIGLGIGGGMGTAWCIGAIADDSGDIDARVECAEGFTVFPGLGALIGLAVDAMIPGRVRVVYQARLSQDASPASLMVVPLFSSRVKGLAASFAF